MEAPQGEYSVLDICSSWISLRHGCAQWLLAAAHVSTVAVLASLTERFQRGYLGVEGHYPENLKAKRVAITGMVTAVGVSAPLQEPSR